MTIRRFLIDICGIFLGVSLTESIERLIDEFSILSLCSFLIVAFLSLNFFFAKVKQLTEEDEVITLFGFVIHVVTLACFATMAFALNNFIQSFRLVLYTPYNQMISWLTTYNTFVIYMFSIF